MTGLFTNLWRKLNKATIGTPAYWRIALQNASGYRDIEGLIRDRALGRVLDNGAGQLAWRPVLAPRASTYISGDIGAAHPELDIVFDATESYPFSDGAFDTVFCVSVLEHAKEPWNALAEMRRVLDSGGRIILSVPFIFYLHGLPHDYYRFSRHGVMFLAEKAGLKVENLISNGGLFHFLLNIPSMMVSSVLFGLGLRRFIAPLTSLFLSAALRLDSWFDRDGAFAMNIVAVLRKD